MTKSEFCEKHNEWQSAETLQTTDVLMRIASNLSDLHIEKHLFTPEQMDEKLINLKKYIFDFHSVLRMEAQYAKYEKQEMDEFISHLG